VTGRQTFVIVGGNLTAGAAATTLRDAGFDGRLVIVGQERHPPYERPPLSKGYLRGESKAEDALLRPRSWYEEADVELSLGIGARRLQPAERTVELDNGERLSYDRLLIATGGRNRTFDVPGHGLEGIHDLRTIEDADRIKAEARSGRTAVIVGAGFIGSEVAASLRHLGVEVQVIEFFEAPLLRVLGPEVAKVYEAIHRDEGVRFHFGEAVEAFDGRGRVAAVLTNKGTRIEGDFVVVGVGIQPNAEWLDGSGVQLDNGVVVDEFCRTNVEGIYAAGDVANHWHPLFERRMRVEHWDNALKQGAAAARNMLGTPTIFDDPHWFWSDQYRHNLQYLGFATNWDDLVVRGSLDERNFVAFYLRNGLVDAVVGLDRGKEVRRSAGLIRARRPFDPAALRDEDVDLRKLAAAALSEGKGGNR
jgi:3-phenylpropionate/trans-cinnamate dioxygenase ferredoxin reductase subunit